MKVTLKDLGKLTGKYFKEMNVFSNCTSRLDAMVPAEDQRIISTPESIEAHYMEFKVLI